MATEIKRDPFGGTLTNIGNGFKYYLIIFALIFVYAIVLITIILPQIEDQQTRLLILAITYVLYIIVLALVVILYYKNVKNKHVIVKTNTVPKINEITKTISVNNLDNEKVVPAVAGSQFMLEFIINDEDSNEIDDLFNPQRPIITNEIYKSSVNNKKELVDKAFAEYMQAISQTPQDHRAHNNLGNVYVYKNMLDEALNEYLEAVRIRPNSYKTLSNLGIACLLTKKYDDATVVLKQSLKIKPDFSPAHNNLGLVYLEKRAFDEAIWEFQAALKYDPTNKEAKLNLDHCIQIKKSSLHEGVAGSLP